MPANDRMSVWSGRTDAADGAQGKRWHQEARPVEEADVPGVVLAGYASDAGVRRNQGRPGAARGPTELRRALGNLAWQSQEQCRLYDAGDACCPEDELETAQGRYAALMTRLLRAGHFPLGLGGGHDIAWSAYQGLTDALQDDLRMERLGIINFDAHLDLRAPEIAGQGTSGTPFLQIAESRAAAGQPFRYLCIGASPSANTRALFDRASSLDAGVVLDVDTNWSNFKSLDEHIGRFVDESSAVYLTFCLDVLPAAAAPGVSAPAAFGVNADLALALLRSALLHCGRRDESSRLLLADVAELNPAYDPDGRTARMAARIVYEIAAVSL